MPAPRIAILVVATLLGGAPVAAHHSGAMFDNDKSVTLKGSVKDFQWTNPHCWIQLTVAGANGAPEEWSVEMGAPLQLFQHGWRPGTLKPGDEIEVVIHPTRDTTLKAGVFVSATGAGGQSLEKKP
jgi:hypothetical protein